MRKLRVTHRQRHEREVESRENFSWQSVGSRRRKKGHAMTKYLISFPSTGMQDIPEEEMPDVANDAHAVVQEAKDADVYIFAGGLDEDVDPVTVAGDGTVTAGTYPLGGITVIDVASREAALEWAAKIAAACRCPQEVSAFMFDPLV